MQAHEGWMRVLFVSPHPDDVEVFAGGAARLHVLAGDRVEEAVLTRGERGALLRRGESLARRRAEEARRAAGRQGYSEVHQLDLGDGRLQDVDAGRPLEALLQATKPDLVYAPEPVHSFYRHPDHLAAGRASLRTFGDRVDLRLYHTRRPDVRVDIAAVFSDKRAALKEHRSQKGLLELGRLYTYLNPTWAGVRRKVEEFRSVPGRAPPG